MSGPRKKKKLKKKDPMSTEEIMKRQARITKLHQEEGKRMKRIGLDIPHYNMGGSVDAKKIAKKYLTKREFKSLETIAKSQTAQTTRINIATLKPLGTVTTAPKNK